MADDFERSLERAFSAAPDFPDAALFAAEVQTRLDRAQGLRRVVIGVTGGVGAAIASMQLLSSNLGLRLEEGAASLIRAANGGAAVLDRDAAALFAAPLQGEVLWLVAGLAAVAVTFAATRFADQV
jgi:hypothetical protein